MAVPEALDNKLLYHTPVCAFVVRQPASLKKRVTRSRNNYGKKWSKQSLICIAIKLFIRMYDYLVIKLHCIHTFILTFCLRHQKEK